MPLVGMGTWPLNGLKLTLLIRKAVKLGYCSFDTASAYKNERWLGYGIKFCGKPRNELFVTTKLSNAGQKSGDIRAAFQNSLKLLRIKYLDLYLMHWPMPSLLLSSW